MPSANKTPLGLHQWQANEYPKMADFNEDNRIIDQKLTELQSGSGVKIYTVEELTDPAEDKIYNVKITKNTSTINGKPVYKENTSESVALKAGKVATVYYQGGNFFYKASASGNAVAENVLADKKFSNDDDTDIAGTMPNHGAKIFKPSNVNIVIPEGFYNGKGYVEGDSDLVSGNIVQGKQIFGVDGSALEYTAKQKEDIANAITSKGVATSTTASFEQMALNIRNIKQMNHYESLRYAFSRLASSETIRSQLTVVNQKFSGYIHVPTGIVTAVHSDGTYTITNVYAQSFEVEDYTCYFSSGNISVRGTTDWDRGVVDVYVRYLRFNI